MATRASTELSSVALRAEPTAPEVTGLPSVGPGELEAAIPRPGDKRGSQLRRLLLLADVAALCLAFFISELAFNALRSIDAPLLLLSIPWWVLLAYAHRLYHLDSHRADYRAADEIGPVLQMATLWSWSCLVAIAVLRPDNVPVTKFAVFWVLTVLLLMTFRAVARSLAKRKVWYLQNALIIGPTTQATAIVRKILRHPEWGINVVACIDVRTSKRFPARTHLFDLVPVVRGDHDVLDMVRRLDIDRVMLAPGLTESRRRIEMVCELSEHGVHVDLVPSWSDVIGGRLDLHEMEGMPLLTVPRTGLRRSSRWLKRALDLAVGTAALVLLSPVLLACALAIKIESPGGALFRQRRVGRDGEPFDVLKFRSMYVDADARKTEVAQLNFHGGGNNNGMFKIREDPRITRVGRVLRRFSLDELPQLFNIVRGEMSLVGPRPLIENEDRQVEGRFRRRLRLTPGLTGSWQVNGRSEIPFEEMVSLDYLYVTNWSIWGDTKLILRTFAAVLRGRGAY
ncbi:MAG TPA: sugar transferase [Thermoleophilaceae bacterium]|nr:sugar transferase [Thermoleophilaceae bacterium]